MAVLLTPQACMRTKFGLYWLTLCWLFFLVMLFIVCLTNLFQYTPTSRSTGIMEARQSKSFSKLQIDQDILLAQLFKTWKTVLAKHAGKTYAARELSTQVVRESLYRDT